MEEVKEFNATVVQKKCLYCSGSGLDCKVCGGLGYTNHFVLDGCKVCFRCIGGTLPNRIDKFDPSEKDCLECGGSGILLIDIGNFGLFSTDLDVV